MNKENNFIKYRSFIEKKIEDISLKDIEVDDYELNTSLPSKHVDMNIIIDKLFEKLKSLFIKERISFNKALKKRGEKDEDEDEGTDEDEKNSTVEKDLKLRIKHKVTDIFKYEVILNDIQQKKHRTKINYTNLILCELLESLNYAKEKRSVGGDKEQLICRTNDLYSIKTANITKIHHQYNIYLQELELAEDIEKEKLSIIKTGSKLIGARKELISLEEKLSAEEKSLNDKIKRSKQKITDAKAEIKASRNKDKANQKVEKLNKKSKAEILKYKEKYADSKKKYSSDIKSLKVEIKALEKTYQIDKKIHENTIVNLKEQINILNDTGHKKLDITNAKITELKIYLDEENKKLEEANRLNSSDTEVIKSIERSIRKIEQQISILEGSVPDNNKARFLRKFNIIKIWANTPFSSALSPRTFQDSYKSALLAVSFDPIKQNRDIIWKAIRYLQSYNLITMADDTGSVDNSYYLNLEHWFKFQKHSFDDNDFIKELLPLLVAFLKYTAPNKVNDFLNSVDKIVDYLYQDPKNYSSSNNKESIVLKALKEKRKLEIEVISGNKDSFFKSITPLELFFDDKDYRKMLYWKHEQKYRENFYNIDKIFIIDKSKKIYLQQTNKGLLEAIKQNTKLNIQIGNIVYEDIIVSIFNYNEIDQEDTVIAKPAEINPSSTILTWAINMHTYPLDEIYSIKLAKTKTATSTKASTADKKGPSFITHQEQYNIPDRKPHSVILEVDMNLSDFFDTGALKNQKMFKTELEKEVFCTENKIPYEKNNRKIYVSAYDKTDDVIHVTKRCLPGVKILKPDDTKEKFQDLMKSICENFK